MRKLPQKTRIALYVTQGLKDRLQAEADHYRIPLSSWIVHRYLLNLKGDLHNGRLAKTETH